MTALSRGTQSICSANFCWLGYVEEIICPWKESVAGKKTNQSVWGDLMSRIAAIRVIGSCCHAANLFSSSKPPSSTKGWIWPLSDTLFSNLPPPPPHWRSEFFPMTTPKLVSNYWTYVCCETSELSQFAGCRCTFLAGNSSSSLAGSEEQINFPQQSPKML